MEQGDLSTSLPCLCRSLRMIDSVESRDMFQLHIACKDSKVVRVRSAGSRSGPLTLVLLRPPATGFLWSKKGKYCLPFPI